MMMKTPFRSNTSRLGRSGFVLTGVAVLAVLVLFFGPFIRDSVASLLAHVPEAYATLPRSILISRLTAAETELTRTRYQALLYQHMDEKVHALETELKLRSHATYGAARVLAAPPRTHYDTLLLDTGSSDGVRMGDSVSVQGFAIGTVTEVSPYSSLVELYSSPGSTHDAILGNEKGIIILHGTGGGSLEALVPGDITIETGDVVRDARSEYVFGVVVAVRHRETDTEQYISIALPQPPGDIRIVSLTHAP
jgi:cell shape-determining protein MreC